MHIVVNFPPVIFAVSFVALCASALVGMAVGKRPLAGRSEVPEGFAVVQGAALTLLGLLIGFAFSMAITRYDQRKVYEEEEANAIGTEFLRADFLPAADGAKVRELLRSYLDQRVQFYVTRDPRQLRDIGTATARVQNDLWSAIQADASAHQTPLVALLASGMNDVLNAEGYAQAAWWNRIPRAAWALLAVIAICCNALIGYGARRGSLLLVTVVPFLVSVSFFLIADIDSPRSGIIRVQPQNLMRLAQTLRGPN
jgi:hypothetical protein